MNLRRLFFLYLAKKKRKDAKANDDPRWRVAMGWPPTAHFVAEGRGRSQSDAWLHLVFAVQVLFSQMI